ncbi:DNA ligase [Campylobacter sp. MIT 99-7217]|uniref:DNA ligase n=1 Tax=Campylobacter sp. MIT 99-7217 TaxID=535091 RepID=UPI00115A7F8A|nr:DNA ligase [Campylobacter sp. MIT 99-7217]TQR29196.1 DNA ligase [Campylobacter sp. MIT 99-7217]
MKFGLIFFLAICAFAQDILLLSEYDPKFFKDKNLSAFVMSEKLDGVRGIWDGKELRTRKGYKINTPDFFIKDFPPFALDGELFISRTSFNELSALINKNDINNELWQEVTYNVFDVPSSTHESLNLRLKELELHLQTHKNRYIKIIPQLQIKDENHLQEYFQSVIKQGGEGLVIRLEKQNYERKRSQNAFKMKEKQDKECMIIAFMQGKGKYEKAVGSVLCEDLQSKVRFKIGSGFKDEFRFNPPPLGTIITYKFSGYTKKGLPKFPVFLRIREEK